jgi:hypothetical protein
MNRIKAALITALGTASTMLWTGVHGMVVKNVLLAVAVSMTGLGAYAATSQSRRPAPRGGSKRLPVRGARRTHARHVSVSQKKELVIASNKPVASNKLNSAGVAQLVACVGLR